VDVDTVAWAEAYYNEVAISVEHEGVSGDALTTEQQVADVGLKAWLYQTLHIPLNLWDGHVTGWAGHYQLGIEGGNHPDCPGTPVMESLPARLAAALIVVHKPTPENGEEMFPAFVAHTASGQYLVFGNGVVAALDGEGDGAILTTAAPNWTPLAYLGPFNQGTINNIAKA
jgi:hypothetical protein